MKYSTFIITGITLLSCILSSPKVRADICNPLNIATHYQSIYCGIRLNDNEAVDNKIIEILSKQFDLNADIIKEILANNICESAAGQEEDFPEVIKNACLPNGKSVNEILGNWNIFADIRNAYEKEKVIHQSKMSLLYKFKTSEQYWDGKIGPGPDAPFDLIVDLNLIDIVLFGSKATWVNNVFTFPPKEGDGQTEEPNLDNALPEEPEEGEKKGFEDAGDPGVTVIEDTTPGLPGDCVPANDPEADLEDPSITALCGNGSVDILMGETCDDGNKQSGDGCNQYCKKEISGGHDGGNENNNEGLNLQCIDGETITFKSPDSLKSSSINQNSSGGTTSDTEATKTDNNKNQSQCPPGMVPKKIPKLVGTEAVEQQIKQNPEYPGPSLGGTLKQFPKSERPLCGPGESAVEITVAGKKEIAKDDEGNPRCLPTQFCADFNAARDFLFGKEWEDDEQVANIAPAIEALFCVNVIKENRPLSIYSKNEGCVDCHITAMTDALEKALQGNVSPLKNTTSAFGISSKFGPNFSFNLLTAIKGKVKYKHTDTIKNAIGAANQTTEQSAQDNTPPILSLQNLSAPLAGIAKETEKTEQTREGILNDTRNLRLAGEALSEQEVGGRVTPLIIQMKNSFTHIQSAFEDMISTTALNEKKQCIP